MVILTIIMASLMSVLVSASHTEIDINKRFQAQQNDRTGLDKLRREIHCANAVTDRSGNSLTPGTAYNAITVTLPGQCPTASGGVTTYATWCTSPSALTTGDFALYRVTSTTLALPDLCLGGKGQVGRLPGVPHASRRSDAISASRNSSNACSGVLKPTNSLPLLHVSLPVNLNGHPPTFTKQSHNPVDDIAL
jgi:hypothetical protein